MFTTVDKALAALLMAVIFFLSKFGVEIPFLTPDMVQIIAVGVSPFLVWWIANKQKS